MGNYRGDFGIKINLKKAPDDQKIPEKLLEDLIQIFEKHKLLDDLNYIKFFRIDIELKGRSVDA